MARHNVVGKIGEGLAAHFLRDNGYKILHRNFKTQYSEIDIICEYPRRNYFWEKRELVFVEVRTKTGERYGSPEETINLNKKRKLSKDALAYVSFNSINANYRIDAICIVLNRNMNPERISHHKNILL